VGYHGPMTTTQEPTMTDATYTLPVIGTRVPCRLVSRQTAPSGRPTATIVIPAEHSRMGVDVDLTVADRSVTEVTQ
jgi:hypothetical protein